jgi:RND family efflux transporter MFP subunit
VAQLGEKELVVNVPERAVGQMKQAKGFMAQFDAIPGKTYAATLRELAPAADAASRTYAAKLSITNADDALKLGMSATVRLDLGAAQVIVVPNTALYTRDNATRVWLVDRASETVRAVEIKLGESTNEGVTVASGLKTGDLVVTAGANLLQAGQKVRLIDVPAASSAAPAAVGAGSAPTPAPAKAAPAAVVPASAKP